MSNLSFPKDLRDRILFTVAVLVIYRVGVQVPTPGVDNEAVLSFFQAQGGGVFGLLNTFTGGALERFSVFALGIIPYITASIIFQLLQSGVPYLEQLKKEGESGRNKINQYTRYATVLLSIFQGYGISKFLMASTSPEGLPLVVTPYFGAVPFSVFTIITLTAGSCLIMWLGERINEKGVGNGASLIIFAGIAAGIPSGAINLFQMIKSGEMSGGLGLGLGLFMVLVVGVIIFIEAGLEESCAILSKSYGQTAFNTKLSFAFKTQFVWSDSPYFCFQFTAFSNYFSSICGRRMVKRGG